MPQPAASSSNLQRRLRCVRARRRVAGRRWQALLGWAGLRSMTRKPRRMLPPNSVNVAIMMRTKKLEGSIGDDLAIAVAQQMGMARALWITKKGEIDVNALRTRAAVLVGAVLAPRGARPNRSHPGPPGPPGEREGSGDGRTNDRRRGCAGEPARAEAFLEGQNAAAKPCWASARRRPRRPPGDGSICPQTLRRLTRAGSARRGPRRPAPGPGTRDWLGVFWPPLRHR